MKLVISKASRYCTCRSSSSAVLSVLVKVRTRKNVMREVYNLAADEVAFQLMHETQSVHTRNDEVYLSITKGKQRLTRAILGNPLGPK
jgi:hypothetical protein